jgi:3-oxoadipate enol-lactonase
MVAMVCPTGLNASVPSEVPVLRGRYRQPRYAMKAQYDATTRFDATARLSQITAPVLIVHGTSDHVAPVDAARQMHALIPAPGSSWSTAAT